MFQVKAMSRTKYDKDVSLTMNFYLMTHFLLAILASDLLTSHFQVSTPLSCQSLLEPADVTRLSPHNYLLLLVLFLTVALYLFT